MKTLVTNYTFSAATKQITLTDYPSLKLDQILLITNVTNNVIIYNFADPTAGGTLSNNILTLLYDTTSMSDSDRLQIFIDDYTIPATEASLTAVQVKIDNTNTLLNALTAKQDTFNFDISSVNVNTNELEGLITNSNTRLDVLTAVDYATKAKQDSIITLLNVLTANTDTLEINTDGLESLVTTVNQNVSSANNNLLTFNRQLTSQILTINQNVSATNTRLASIDTDLSNIYSDTQNYLYFLSDIYTDTQNISNDTSNISSVITTLNQAVSTINTAINNTLITQSTTPTLTSSLLITGQKRVYSIFGVSTSTNNQYIHIYNSSTSAPASTPVAVFSIPANSNFSFDINKGLNFTSGCLVTNSLTLTSFSGGMNDLYFTVVHSS